MSLGFQEEYSLSNYSREEFIEVWSESSIIAKEIIDSLLSSFNASKVIKPGESSELVRYIRGVLFVLGFDEADQGVSADLYDKNVSAAVIKSKALMKEIKMTIDDQDSVNQKFIMNLSDIFNLKDESKILGIWRALNSPAVINAKSLTPDTKSPVGPSAKGLAAAAVSVPASSVNKGEGANVGVNFPNNKKAIENSIQYSLAKDGEKRLSPNFKVSDFRCKDGSDIILINPSLVSILEKIREHFGKPVVISSGYRTPSYNRRLPGAAKNSQHMYGNAADITISGVAPIQIYNWIKSWHKGGVGIYNTFVHVDVRDTIGERFATWDNRTKGKDVA